MVKPLYCFIGPSASGKTTIANMLEEQYSYKQVQSYTTRPPRYEGEVGHIFIDDVEFRNLGELAAYTFYNGYQYGTTFSQLDECDIYVIDVSGLKCLLEKYSNRPIYVIYFDASVKIRIERMIDRSASDMEIVSRIHTDGDSWYDELDHLVWKYKYLDKKSVNLYRVNADQNKEDVLEQVLYYMRGIK